MTDIALQPFIDQYKAFVQSPEYQENYKWEIFQNFKNHWNIDAPDFRSMLDQSIRHREENLWQSMNYYPKRMLLEFAERFPEEVRDMFRQLSDEALDLNERIVQFIEKATHLINLHKPGKNSYQDKRAV
jgi:5-methylcytosine-specific restriction protein B